METTTETSQAAPTVTRSEKLDIDLREMGCRYVGKFKALDQTGRAMHQYVTPNGKLLFVYDLGDSRGWDVFGALTDANDIPQIMQAIRAHIAHVS